MSHPAPHPRAGHTVTVTLKGAKESVEYRIEDYWDRVSGMSWMDGDGNPACLQYAFRAGSMSLPWDDEVLYGKIGSFGHLVHVSEIMSAAEEDPSDEGTNTEITTLQ